jgi:hypothetical protein
VAVTTDDMAAHMGARSPSAASGSRVAVALVERFERRSPGTAPGRDELEVGEPLFEI